MTTLPFDWQLLGSTLLNGGFTTAIHIVEFVAAVEANLLVRSSKAGRVSVPVLRGGEGCIPREDGTDTIGRVTRFKTGPSPYTKDWPFLPQLTIPSYVCINGMLGGFINNRKNHRKRSQVVTWDDHKVWSK